MEPFRSHPGPQTTIFLAGCILSCLLQLVPAEENLTVVSVPEKPTQGQTVFLYATNLQDEFEQCQWVLPSGRELTFVRGTKVSSSNTTQLIVMYQNCSLSIQNVKSADQGRYRMKATFPAEKQQFYIGSIFLTVCDDKKIRIKINPESPHVGQDVVLIPEGIPIIFSFCSWKQKTQSEVNKVLQDYGQEPNKQQNQQSCSLRLSPLTHNHKGNYSIYVEVSSDQQSGTGGKENREQTKCYRSQTQLKVKENGAASLKYSAGIIAGTLLGSLTWTNSLTLMPLFFSVLSPFFPEC